MRVLVVDNETAWRRTLSRSLGKKVLVDEAERLQDALDCVLGTSYDVVIAADVLPDGSGLDLLERVRKVHHLCRRVLVSRRSVLVMLEAEPAIERLFIKPDDLMTIIGWLSDLSAPVRDG